MNAGQTVPKRPDVEPAVYCQMDAEDRRQAAALRSYLLEVKAPARAQRIAAARPRVTTPAPRRAQSSGRPAGRPSRTRRTSGSRGDPPPDSEGEPAPPSRRGELRQVGHALAAFLAEVRP